MKYAAICFACIFIYKIAFNTCALIRINFYAKKYSKYLTAQNTDFIESTIPIKQLFGTAGLSEPRIPCVQPVGYGKIFEGHASLFSNMSVIREDIVANMLRCFAEARGVFKHRLFEAFSPLYWVNCIIFLPRRILEYLGIKGDSIAVRILQLLYWFATPPLLVFRDRINEWVLEFFG